MSRCFLSKNPHLLTRAFTSYFRPILEYASPVWSPHFAKDIDALEREFNVVSQNQFTIFVPLHILLASSDSICSHFTFAVLILILPLVTALFMNSLISILHSSSYFAHIQSLAVIHSLSLNLWFDSTPKKFSFYSRTIDSWNNLPITTVTSGSLPAFKC